MSDRRRINEAVAAGNVPPDISADFLAESRDGPAMVAIMLITTLTAGLVICRLLARTLMLQRFGVDDGLALASLLTLAAFVGLAMELIQLGSGRHYAYIQYVLPLSTVETTQVLDFAAHILYTVALLLCRVSGLAFYHRVCSLHRGFLVAIQVVFGLLMAGFLPQLLLIVFHCRPVTTLWPYGWEPGSEEFTCLQWGVVYVTNSTISLTCDMLLFGIPVAMLRILEMSQKRKIQLGCILLPGVAVVAISITRLVLVVIGQWETDMSWSYNALLTVEVSEIGATLIALSVPGVKPIVDRFLLGRGTVLHMATAGGSRCVPNNKASSLTSKHGTALSTLKLRSDYSVLGAETAANYGTEVSAGSQGNNISQEGIHVTVDFRVNDGEAKRFAAMQGV
ncbi:proteinrelated to integral membrane protein pth11 [Ophiocordyceps camponoti-floridani]|uniref:Proteinrelated to integral membrane protein pth11 n=1 Tax=Ophiocordyceps camponoti-floridani TaxID=2030778 RepID=A0A8H4VH42_9HYPO|nr:proteinrelated to integral membrane protein pth11 [Ophiocordyceps camponoti-floridani]